MLPLALCSTLMTPPFSLLHLQSWLQAEALELNPAALKPSVIYILDQSVKQGILTIN